LKNIKRYANKEKMMKSTLTRKLKKINHPKRKERERKNGSVQKVTHIQMRVLKKRRYPFLKNLLNQ